MSGKNKFGLTPVELPATEDPAALRRSRAPGPMGAAVRDAAESLQEATEAKIEQRRRNSEDARAWRTAKDEGRVLVRLPVAEIETDDLPRDRLELEAVAQSDEMEELKASIRERGQKEPIEVYVDGQGRTQLKKGWRRLTALAQLFAETGDPAFAEVVARVEPEAGSAPGPGARMTRYIDMVEENVVREDLTFAEMAQLAIAAAADPEIEERDPAELVGRLYGALHKTKRSYIRSFVHLLGALGDSLKWPKAVGRNLGVDVSRALKTSAQAEALRVELQACGSPEAQARVLTAFMARARSQEAAPARVAPPKQKFEFFLGDTKVTARLGECRIVSERDFASVPKARLEEAIRAFEAALDGGPRTR